MTPPIPAADAIRGLVDALRRIEGGYYDGPDDDAGWNEAALTASQLDARDAIAGWDRRAPLRDAADLRVLVRNLIAASWNSADDDMNAGLILDLVDSALFGPAAKERSRG